MADRNKRILVFIPTLLMGTLGCGLNQQSKFQMSFLPAAPHSPVLVADISDMPPIPANVYLAEGPRLITQPIQKISEVAGSRAENLMRRAESRFQKGKKFYSAKDAEHAREEFDSAVDLMLQASESGPVDRVVFDRKFDEMIEQIHRYDMAGMGAAVNLDEQTAFEKAPLEDILEMTFPVDPRLKNRVIDQVKATASQLPLEVNDTVLGYINYFSGRGKNTIIAGMRRSGRYRPLIQRILDEEGLPQELIHLAQAESGFIPRAVSRAAATGMWQFVQFRGRQYGLMQTRYSDDRMDPEKATRAAARHLRDLYNEFGDWYLAIAAYNCGPGTIERAVERTGYADFFQLRARGVLPAETTNYVPIILAMTIMEKNAKEYGLDQIVFDAPIEYDTVELTAPTHLALIADMAGVPAAEIASLNPAVLKGIAPEGYPLRVPKGAGTSLMAALQLVPADRRASWRVHKVENGETLATIGKRYGTTANSIAAANRLSGSSLEAGDTLIIPAVYRESAVASGLPKAAPAAKRSAGNSKRATTTRRTTTPAKNAPKTQPAKRKRPAVHTASASNTRTGG